MWLRLFTIFRNYLPVSLIFFLLFLVLIVLYASRFIFVLSYCLFDFEPLFTGISLKWYLFLLFVKHKLLLRKTFLFLTHKAFAKVKTTNLIICLIKLSRNFLCSHKIIGRLIILLTYFSLFCYGRVLGASK